MKRLLVIILVPAIMFGGCAHDVYKYDRSLPPLDQQARIPVLRLWPGDQLRQHQVVYGELADNTKILPDVTIELEQKPNAPRSKRASDDQCASFPKVLACSILQFLMPVIVLTAAIVVLPVAAVQEASKTPDSRAAASADESRQKTQKPVETENVASSATATTGAGTAQTTVGVPTLPADTEKSSLREINTKWLAGVVMDGQWFAELDGVYIAALNQALDWKVPADRSSVEQPRHQQNGKFASAPADMYLSVGISKIVLLDSNLGEWTLILCAKSLIERGAATVRSFETCQSENIGRALPQNSPASSEALRLVLVEQARKLSALQAKALTAQTKFVQATW